MGLRVVSKKSPTLLHSEFGQFTILFLILLVSAVVGQWFTGVYRSDLSDFADAGSHYINGLLIHDYLVDGFANNPLATRSNTILITK